MTDVVTYHSANAKAHQAWIAYALLPDGSQWQVRCEGSTEAEAADKARNLYANERRRQEAIWPNGAVELSNETAQKWVNNADGRGHHFAGKVWVFHPETKHKARVSAELFDQFAAKGYVRGGPRSK